MLEVVLMRLQNGKSARGGNGEEERVSALLSWRIIRSAERENWGLGELKSIGNEKGSQKYRRLYKKRSGTLPAKKGQARGS